MKMKKNAAYQYDLWVDEYNLKYKKRNNIEKPENFIPYVNTRIKVEELPLYISKNGNMFLIRINRKRYGTYSSLKEAEIELKKILKKIEQKRIGDIRAQPIKRNEEDLAIISYRNDNIIVDDDDYYNLLIAGKIIISRGYAVLKLADKPVLIHRYLLNYDGDLYVDHINNDSLDNRKSNLRLATPAQNAQNTSSRKNSTSKYVGIYWYSNRNKWHVQIKVDGKKKHIGYFDDEIEAAKARDSAVFKAYGEFANLNFPLEI